MILITGGLGFIGLHTAAALLEMGEKCVLTQHRLSSVPEKYKPEIGSRLFVEQLDVTDGSSFLALGEKYPITGVVHLAVHWNAGPGASAAELYENSEANLRGLANAVQAAQTWKAKRVLVASTHNVYGEEPGNVWREDRPLDLSGSNPVLAIKKSMEIMGDFLESQTGIECIMLRFGEIYGPLNHWNAIPNILAQAAVKGESLDLGNAMGGATATDGCDRCYIKDAARAVGLLQLAPTLQHRVYNIGSGRPNSNQELVAAIRETIPEAQLELPSASEKTPLHPSYLDITRLTEDTGYQPQFTPAQGMAEYLAWLKAGNEI